MRICFFVGLVIISLKGWAQPNTDIFLLDLDNTDGEIKVANFQNISNKDGYDNQPFFIDNNNLLYAGTRNEQTDIVQYDIKSGNKSWLSATEGSEYSPHKIPNTKAVSAIRLDKDGLQRLYQYGLNGSTPTPILDTLVVGYQLWINENTLITTVLENNSMSLYLSTPKDQKSKKIAENVGRSLQRIPHSNLISFISKEKSPLIKSYNLATGEIKSIAPALPGSEDLCWLSSEKILMAQDDALFELNTNKASGWHKMMSLDKFGIKNITRMAVSPDGKTLALVAELDDIALAPTLENIKWIAGNWKGEAFGGQTEENWSEPSGGSMMATFKLIDDGKVVFYEMEIIREVENSLILQLKHFGPDLKGWETQEKTIDFNLIKITSDRVVFEGMVFEKISPNEMNVYVDIQQDDGTIENVKFNYRK